MCVNCKSLSEFWGCEFWPRARALGFTTAVASRIRDRSRREMRTLKTTWKLFKKRQFNPISPEKWRTKAGEWNGNKQIGRLMDAVQRRMRKMAKRFQSVLRAFLFLRVLVHSLGHQHIHTFTSFTRAFECKYIPTEKEKEWEILLYYVGLVYLYLQIQNNTVFCILQHSSADHNMFYLQNKWKCQCDSRLESKLDIPRTIGPWPTYCKAGREIR